MAGFGHFEFLFWRVLAIWNHCEAEAEAETEAALDIANDEVHVWSEITGYGNDAKPEKTREITLS